MKTTLLVVAGIVGLLIVVPIVVFFTADPNWLKPRIEAAASTALGRNFAIRGPLELERGWVLQIRARDVHLANAGWSDRPDMASVETIEASLDLWQLLTRWRVVLPDIRLAQPIVNLQRNRRGDPNWNLGPVAQDAAAIAAPDKRTDIPEIIHLTINDAKLDYLDDQAGFGLQSTLASVDLMQKPGSDKLAIKAKGEVGNTKLDLDAMAGSYALLTGSTQPYPLAGTLQIGGLHSSVDGSIGEPARLEGVDLTLRLEGDDIGPVLALFKLPAPDLPPFSLAGRLSRKAMTWRIADLDGKIGDTDLKGELGVELAGVRPKIVGSLVSEHFDVDDLGGTVGLPPGTGKGETASSQQKQKAKTYTRSDWLFPDVKLEPDRLRSLDVDFAFKGKQVNAGALPFESVDMRVLLNDGQLRLDPLRAVLAKGQLNGTLALDSNRDPMTTTLDFSASKLKLQTFLKEVDLAGQGLGTVSARLKVAGKGDSLRKAVSSADGQMTFGMEGGEISMLLIEGLGIDPADIVGALLTSSKADPLKERYAVRCAVFDFGLKDGEATAKSVVIDTDDSVITADGTVNFGTEALALNLEAHPKDMSFFSARVPVHLRGKIRDISVEPDATGLVARGAAAVAIGVFLTPLASILPFIDLGGAEDAPCAQLMAKTGKRQSSPVQKPKG